MRILRLAFLLCCLVSPGLSRAADPLAHGRVVLLSGLPGDVESDRLYQRQLLSLLEVLDAAGVKPSSVHILAHDPAKLELSEKWREASVEVGNREAFLALGHLLGESVDPISLIVWGHGGLMRGEPVFHVSGPRLTRSDFKSFSADAAKSGAPLRWLLYFVGSGEIVPALQEKSGEILASENTTRFTSDPIGLDILIESWKKQPQATLEALGRAAGPGIAARYTSRSAARTEEPTFFAAGQSPLILADLEAGQAPAASASPAAEGLPEHWKKVQRVDAKAYPGSDAVVLSRSIKYTLGENPVIDEEIEEYTQILTSEGKRRGDFALSFSPPDEDLTFLSLDVLSPSGQVQAYDPENVLDEKPTEVEGYGNHGRKIFSLPSVEPGAIIHAHYRRVWKRFPFPHVFLTISLADEIPIVHESVQVEASKAEPLSFHLAHTPEIAPVLSESSYGRLAKWEWNNVPAFREETLAEPGGVPELQITAFPNWQDFAEWYQRLIREADNITDAIRAKTKEITAGLTTPEQKVKALFEFVTGMRYIAIPLGVNSYRPHAADNVLRNRYGDCKDKANLLNTMLRAAGFEANLVLVPRFSQADPSVPGLAFNHAISRVELPGGPMFLDATDDVCPFGMLPPGDGGRNVLVVGQGNELTRLPDPNAADHRMEIEFAMDEHFAGQVNLAARGFAGYHLRAASRESDEKNGTLPLLAAAGLSFAHGAFVIQQDTHTPASQLDGDFKWQAEGQWSGLATATRGGRLLFAPFALPETWKLSLQKRSRELFLNNGYPLSLKQTARFRFAAPATSLPPVQEQADGPLRWRLSWKQQSGALVGDLQIDLPQALLGGDQIPAFQGSYQRLLEALATPVNL